MQKMAKENIKKPSKKEQRTEKQAMIIMFVAVAIIAAVLTIYIAGPMLKKPYFDFHGYKVYRVALEGTDMMFYNIPDVSFTVKDIEYKRNVVVRSDPRELESMNKTIEVSSKFFKTLPVELWIKWDENEKAKIYEAELEIKKFANNLNIPVGIVPPNVSFDCSSTTDLIRLIILKSNSTITDKYESFIYTNTTFPNCIIIASNSYDNLIRASDAFVIEWLMRTSA